MPGFKSGGRRSEPAAEVLGQPQPRCGSILLKDQGIYQDEDGDELGQLIAGIAQDTETCRAVRDEGRDQARSGIWAGLWTWSTRASYLLPLGLVLLTALSLFRPAPVEVAPMTPSGPAVARPGHPREEGARARHRPVATTRAPGTRAPATRTSTKTSTTTHKLEVVQTLFSSEQPEESAPPLVSSEEPETSAARAPPVDEGAPSIVESRTFVEPGPREVPLEEEPSEPSAADEPGPTDGSGPVDSPETVPDSEGCPYVAFMYDLPWPFDDLKPVDSGQESKYPAMAKSDASRRVRENAKKRRYTWFDKEYSFGPNNEAEEGVWRIASSNVLGNLIYYRLSNSRCMTKDPKEADIFVIPMWLAAKEHEEWEAKCREFESQAPESSQHLLKHLVHLNKRTTKQHVLFNVKNMRCCKQWWNSPMPPELLHVSRVSVRFCYAPPCDALVETMPMFTVPYPSIVHWSTAFAKKPPWERERTRTHLMSLVMESREDKDTEYFENAEKLRKVLWEACTKYDSKKLCLFEHPSQMPSVPVGLHKVYASSQFCLQPQGDTCERKGILDSILLGCIPVLFKEDACPMKKLWKYHWHGWQEDSVVILELKDVLNKKVDIVEKLEAIPAAKRARMRKTIAEFGHRLQYNLDDPGPGQEDALTLLFSAIVKGKEPLHPGHELYKRPR